MTLSGRVRLTDAAGTLLKGFLSTSRYAERRLDPSIADFTFGNPHEMPLSGVVDAIRERAVPRDKNWFAYKTSEEASQAFLAEHVGAELGLPFEPADFAVTTGAFAAIALAIHMTLDPGQEAVYSSPGWFCYEPTMRAAGVVPCEVRLTGDRFDLDLDAIDAAIGPKTRLVIVNSPHNPTGRIYGRETLVALAACLDRASARIGHRVFLLSDEPYRRLRFDGRDFTSPAAVYPWTLISYSYGKVLLAPGQRIGYLAISPLMPAEERQAFRDAAFSAQMALGWCFPNAVMQYALPDLETLSIDRAALARRRTAFSVALKRDGYGVLDPEGTFYLWVRWPEGDPDRWWNALADRGVFVMPGALMNTPGHFRISLTASDAMVERGLPAFADVAKALA